MSSPIITGFLLSYSDGFIIAIALYSISFILCGTGFLFLKETRLKIKGKANDLRSYMSSI